jgi:hypothetical protein
MGLLVGGGAIAADLGNRGRVLRIDIDDLVHQLFDLRIGRRQDLRHAARTLVPILDRTQIVGDRLVARDQRHRGQDGAEEAGRALVAALVRLAVRVGVDIDDAAHHLAAGRAVAERLDHRRERLVHHHAAVDEIAAYARVGDHELVIDEMLPGRPVALARGEQAVHLRDRRRRKGAGEGSGGAR